MVVYGGYGEGQVFNDIYVLDLVLWSWSEVRTCLGGRIAEQQRLVQPPPRFGHSSWVHMSKESGHQTM
jgi:hypothetical protein